MATSKGYTVHEIDGAFYIRLYKNVAKPLEYVQVEALFASYDEAEQEAALIWDWAMAPDPDAAESGDKT